MSAGISGDIGDMPDTIFRERSARCRRLADAMVNQDDPAVRALRRLAEQYDDDAARMRALAAHVERSIEIEEQAVRVRALAAHLQHAYDSDVA
jgi:molybdopterin synthase catalytic subunit